MAGFIKSFDIYRRGKVAAQFKLAADIDRPGIFVEMSDKAKGDGFDWKDATRFKLGFNDIAKVANGLANSDEEIKLFHDPKAGTTEKGHINKNISFKKSDNGYYMNVSVMEDRKLVKRISIAMSKDEIYILKVLLDISIPKILRWT